MNRPATVACDDKHAPAPLWDRFLILACGVAITAYFAALTLVPNIYAYAPAAVLLLALASFRWKQLVRNVDRPTRWFIAAMVAHFAIQALLVTGHGDNVSDYDLISRFLLAIPVLLFVSHYAPGPGWIFSAAAVGGIGAGGYALYAELALSIHRTEAFDNPIHFGVGAMTSVLISLAALPWAWEQRWRWFWIALLLGGAAGGLAASLLSETRSVWLALPFASLVSLWWGRHGLLARPKRMLAVVVLVAIAGLAVTSSQIVKTRYDQAVQEVVGYFEKGHGHTSVGARLDMWKGGWIAFSTHPLTGIGAKGYDRLETKLVDTGVIDPYPATFRHLHNQFVDYAAKGGLLGLASYVFLLVVFFRVFYRFSKSEDPGLRSLGLAGALLLVGHIVFNQTQSLLERNIGVMMFLFAFVFLWGALQRRRRSLEEQRQ